MDSVPLMPSTMDDLLPGYNSGLVDARLHGAEQVSRCCRVQHYELGAIP